MLARRRIAGVMAGVMAGGQPRAFSPAVIIRLHDLHGGRRHRPPPGDGHAAQLASGNAGPIFFDDGLVPAALIYLYLATS